MDFKRSLLVGLATSAIVVSAPQAAEREEFMRLKAPAPAPALRMPIPAGSKAQAVKFARAVVRPSPGPWARIVIVEPSDDTLVEYATWSEGRDSLDAGAIGAVFADEMVAAGIPVLGASQSLFADESASDLQVGVIVTDMKGRLCRGCGRGVPLMSWVGEMTLDARWEVYSQLRGRVVATVNTKGGFSAPKTGLAGSPERLIYESLRDNMRHLIADEAFRLAIVAEPPGDQPVALPRLTIALKSSAPDTLQSATNSVVSIFAGEAMGSGVLISPEGYILTNHHVAGSSGQVRIRWKDGTDTVGEIMRSDRRRDVALIKTETRAEALPIRRAPPQLGETVFAIGTPLRKEFSSTLTRGVVSGNRIIEGLAFIQSDVAVDHGNSGGPLLDEKGQVVAITEWGYAPDGVSHNLNFFIPIDDALKALAIEPAR